MTSLWSLPWCSTSQGPPSCLQVMVFIGAKLRLSRRGGFSNPDRLDESCVRRAPGVRAPGLARPHVAGLGGVCLAKAASSALRPRGAFRRERRGQLGTRGDAELGEDAVEVCCDRAVREIE